MKTFQEIFLEKISHKTFAWLATWKDENHHYVPVAQDVFTSASSEAYEEFKALQKATQQLTTDHMEKMKGLSEEISQMKEKDFCDCETKYYKHYESDFDRFVKENPKEEEKQECVYKSDTCNICPDTPEKEER